MMMKKRFLVAFLLCVLGIPVLTCSLNGCGNGADPSRDTPGGTHVTTDTSITTDTSMTPDSPDTHDTSDTEEVVNVEPWLETISLRKPLNLYRGSKGYQLIVADEIDENTVLNYVATFIDKYNAALPWKRRPENDENTVSEATLTDPVILVGRFNTSWTKAALQKMGDAAWIVDVEDENVIITGQTYDDVRRALSCFMQAVIHYSDAAGSSRAILPRDFCMTSAEYTPGCFGVRTDKLVSLLSAQMANRESSVFPVDSNDAVYEILYKGIETGDFEACCTLLRKAGFQKTAENTIGQVRYATFVNDAIAVFAEYRPTDASIRFVCESLETAFLPTGALSEPTGGSLSTTLYMRGVTKPDYFDNGMNFIYLLSDGRFVIFDCGQKDAAGADKDHLYHTLRKIADEHGVTDVVVAGWFITHAHEDHVDALPDFFKSYVENGNVRVQYFFINDSSDEQGPAGNQTMEKTVMNAVTKYSPDTPIYRVHAGQVFYMADLRFEIFYTLQDLDPTLWSDSNQASVVMQLTAAGHTILMTGDADYAVWDTMRESLGEGLHSEWMQAPHHGTWDGGRGIDYDAVDPDYILYPCGDFLFSVNQTSDVSNIAEITSYVLDTYTKDAQGNDLHNYWVAGICTSATSGRVTEVRFSESTPVVTVYEDY